MYLRCFLCSATLWAPSVPPSAAADAGSPSVRTSISKRSSPLGLDIITSIRAAFHSPVVSDVVQFWDHDFLFGVQSSSATHVSHAVADGIVDSCVHRRGFACTLGRSRSVALGAWLSVTRGRLRLLRNVWWKWWSCIHPLRSSREQFGLKYTNLEVKKNTTSHRFLRNIEEVVFFCEKTQLPRKISFINMPSCINYIIGNWWKQRANLWATMHGRPYTPWYKL